MPDRQQVRWGILGAAGVATRRFVPALQEAHGAELAVVGSRVLERAAGLVEKAGQGRAVGSYQDVVDAPDVDAVYIPLPNSLHEQWILTSLAAGKHVLCEKPLVMGAEAVQRIDRAAAAADRVVMEAFMYRLHPQYEPATWTPLLEQLGPLRSAYARLSFPLNRPGDIREQPALGGGALWDAGCYCLNLLCWQLGDVVDVRAIGDMRGGVDWTAAVQFRHASGALSTAWWSFAGPLDQRLTLIGEQATLELFSPFRATGPAPARLQIGAGVRELQLPDDNCFRREIEHFGDLVRDRGQPAVPLSDSERWIRVAEDVERQVQASADASTRPAPSAHPPVRPDEPVPES